MGISQGIESGLNSEIEHGGRQYHVQTQCSRRGAPVIESLVFSGGQTLVRITASWDDVAQRLGFNGDDGRHLLELQHADLIRKIRHGMLSDDDAAVAPPPVVAADAPFLIDAEGNRVDPAEVGDPAVEALLHELGVRIDAALTLPAEPPSLTSSPAARPASTTAPPAARAAATPEARSVPAPAPAATGPSPLSEPVAARPARESEPARPSTPVTRRKRRRRRWVLCIRLPF